MLHHAIFDENYEAVAAMKEELPFFRDIMEHNEVDEGWTPLTLAYRASNMKIAKLLIDEGASPLLPTTYGWTIFHLAAMRGDPPLLDYAIKQNRHYTLDIRSQDGSTPAQMAC